jgi:glycosyltransferase involved in cell wall biosynthesis
MTTKPLNVTVISHACVLPANQKVWARVIALDPGIRLRLIAPRRWKSSLHGRLDFAALPELAHRAVGIRVHCSGSLHLHTYSDLGPALTVELPDILFLDEDPHSLLGWQVLGIQAILSFQTIITLRQNILKKYPFPFSLIERGLFRSTSAAAATSEECLAVARAKHYRQPATVVHYPIDVETFQPGEPCRAPGEMPFRVGYAGRLVPEKGVADLIHAVAQVQDRQRMELVIAGNGPEKKRLLALAESLPELAGLVHWSEVPHQEMADWYRSLDVLVLPSRATARWKEQFGRVLAEAMARERPVIGADTGFIPELIRSTEGGLVFPEGDVDALAQALLRLGGDESLRRELAQRGRQKVVELYSVDAVAGKLVELIRSVPV